MGQGKRRNKIMEAQANALEKFMEEMTSSFIYTGMSKDEYKHHKKVVKKTIKKLRDHDDSVYNDPDNIDPDGITSAMISGDDF